MTEHQLSVVIKANADISSLEPFKAALDDIASRVEAITGKLDGLASSLSGNQALNGFLSSVQGSGTINLNVTTTGGQTGGGTQTGSSVPSTVAEIKELAWKGDTTDPRLEEVVAIIKKVTFGQGVNDDSARKQLKGVIGHVKGLRWDSETKPESNPIDVVGRIVDAKLTDSEAKKIAGKLSKTKLEIIPELTVRTEDAEGNMVDFGKKVKDTMVTAIKNASSLELELTSKDFEKMLSPLQSSMDDYVSTTMKHVNVYAQPKVLKKDLAKFVSETNADLREGKADYVLKFLSKPVVIPDKIKEAYENIDKDLSSRGDFVNIPGILGVQEVVYFVNGQMASVEEFQARHKLVIPAVIRPVLEETDTFNDRIANDMSPEGHANGKIVTVGEGNADEMIVHRSLLERGPAYLDKAFASLVRQREGGRNVYLPDYDNTAIIPVDRYLEFKSRIYGGKFADGKGDVEIGGYTEYASALWALSKSMPTVLSRLERMNEYTTRGEIDALIGLMSPALERINANTDELEALVSRYGGDMAAMPQAVREAVLQATSNRDNYSKVMEFFQQRLTQADKTEGELNEFLKRLGDTSGETNKKLERIEQALGTIVQVESSAESKGSSGGGLEMSRWQQAKSWAASEEGQSRIMDTVYKVEGRALSAGANISETLLKKTLGLVQDIYNKMKEASPLLQTVSTLFNLAMRLFFMPLGNKLAEILIPKTVELVEKITDMWDMFDEGTSLGDMFNKAIDYGFEVFGEYFMGIGDRLQEQGGIISSVGGMLASIGKFLESNGKSLIQFLTGMMGSIIDHFREIIATIVAFKVASTTLSVMQLAATLTPDPLNLGFSKALAAAILIPAAMGIVAGGIATGALYAAIPGKADGGFVPATPGGRPTLLAEGGEGEFVIPASKMAQVIAGGLDPLMQVVNGSSVRDAYPSTGGLHLNSLTPSGVQAVGGIGSVVNANYYISGYTDSELEGIIQRTVNDMTYDSRLKGRYW